MPDNPLANGRAWQKLLFNHTCERLHKFIYNSYELFCVCKSHFQCQIDPLCISQFSKNENGGENRMSLPQIPFFGIWGRQEVVLHWSRTSLISNLVFQVLWVF